MYRFKVDENLPLEATKILAGAGHDAVTVLDQKMGGRSDLDVIAACTHEARALITLDLDFADIRAYPPADYAGIIVLRLARLYKPQLLSVIKRLVPLLEREPLTGKLWIVDESTLRVRS